MFKEKQDIINHINETNQENLYFLDFLIQNEEDAHVFKQEFKYSQKSDIQNIHDFRQIQRIRKSLGKQEFIQLYRQNKKEALETLFQEPLTDTEVNMFKVEGEPLEEIYRLSTDNLSLPLIHLLDNWEHYASIKSVPSFKDAGLAAVR